MRVLLLLLSILCFVTTSGYLSVASETHDKAHRPKSLLHQHLGKQTRAVLLKKKHTTHANHTSSQQGGDVDVKGPLCQIGYAFKESSFRSSWFLPGSSISTNGKHVEALLVPDSLGDPRSLFNKKVLSELWDGIAPAYMVRRDIPHIYIYVRKEREGERVGIFLLDQTLLCEVSVCVCEQMNDQSMYRSTYSFIGTPIICRPKNTHILHKQYMYRIPIPCARSLKAPWVKSLTRLLLMRAVKSIPSWMQIRIANARCVSLRDGISFATSP